MCTSSSPTSQHTSVGFLTLEIEDWPLKSPSDPLTLIVNEETEHALATELVVNGHGK